MLEAKAPLLFFFSLGAFPLGISIPHFCFSTAFTHGKTDDFLYIHLDEKGWFLGDGEEV